MNCSIICWHNTLPRMDIKYWRGRRYRYYWWKLKQLHSREVLEPNIKDDFQFDERKNSLRYLMFLQQKNSGQIKGRGFADDRPQRKFMSKEDISSPMVAIESLMLSCTINATRCYKCRYSWWIHTDRYDRQCTCESGQKNSWATGKNWYESISPLHSHVEWQKSCVCEAVQSTVWHSPDSTTFLANTLRNFWGGYLT